MNRVAVVGGCRTPFVRAGGVYSNYSFVDLGLFVVNELVQRHDIKQIDEFIFSTVLLDPRTPNAAREIVLKSKLPKTTNAHFISNNCISGLVAINFIKDGIASGRISSGIAGGSESMSRPSLSFSYKAEQYFYDLFKARTLVEKLKQLAKLKLRYLKPIPPSPKEPSTQLTMGQHCEITTKEFKITREEQDLLALKSHANASKAIDAGYFNEEIVPFSGLQIDNLVRKDTSLERLAKLKPVFDKTGTLTAGNSSALTDGASAVFLMSESEAKKSGYEILGYIEAVEFAAINPNDGLLMAPGLALPRLLEKTNNKVSDIDVFEIHEAFAAQVISNLKVWESGWTKYPEIKPIGKIPDEKININGGSLALGHPFAATGSRLIMSTLNQLKRSGKNKGVISVCAAGAMAAALLVTRD